MLICVRPKRLKVDKASRSSRVRKTSVSEVYLGVQFLRSSKYREIFAKNIWDLFSEEFPIVEEQIPLPPDFEAFGAPGFGVPSMNLQFGPQHTRYWFKQADSAELLQFQGDRFIHNWAKWNDDNNVYPRFDVLSKKFISELKLIRSTLKGLTSEDPQVTQFEVSYTNLISTPIEVPLEVEDWIRAVDLQKRNVDDFAFSFKQPVEMPHGNLARLHVAVSGVASPSGGPALSLSLVVRGAPPTDEVQALVESLSASRNIIVQTFTEVTTDSAHAVWKRLK